MLDDDHDGNGAAAELAALDTAPLKATKRTTQPSRKRRTR